MTLIDEIRIHPEEGAKRLESECKPGLQALARRLCSDEGDAEELVNRTLAEAVAHIDSLISRPALFGWMCQILVDCHAKDNRRKSRSAEAPDNETVAAAVDEDAEARLFREVDAGILRDAIETLPDDIRKTVVMHYFMGVPVREAAKVLSVPTGTVAWRLHYARMLLAAKLGAAAKKPGGKALLVALVLAALTAVGATVATIVGEARNTPPALSEGTPLSEGGYAAQDSSPLQEGAVAEGDWGSTAPDTSTSPTTGDTMNTTKTTSTLAAAALAVATGIASAETQPTPSASLYVQDGLVACWDGVENAGTGLHDANATVWKDLVGGREFTLTGVTVGDNRMTFAGAKTSYGSLNATDAAVFLAATNGTVEVAYASTQSGNAIQTLIQGPTESGVAMTLLNQKLLLAYVATTNGYSISYGMSTNTTAIRYTGARPTGAFQNASALSASTSTSTGGSKTTATIGMRSDAQGVFKGHIFCIRVYNRHLTADELASNRELDLDRFVRGTADVTTTRKVKIANFDEDLATVYVNGEPATNGAIFTVANGASVALTLRDFQSDWYFAYAPPSQTDRTLALDFWGGLPAEAASNQNPCVFIPREYLTTVVPNVDCKGYVWYAVDANAAISNSTYKIAASSFNAAKRSLTAGAYSAYYGGDKVMDLAMRVRKDGINHTVTYLNGGFAGQPSTVRVPRRLTGWGHSLTSGCGGKTMTFVGLQETAVTVVEGYAFCNTYCKVYGAMTNYMPHGALTIGSSWAGNTFYGQAGLTGPLLLPCVTTIYAGSFNGCSGLTELYSTSPNLTTINAKAFYGASKMRKVTLASPVLSSVAGDAFNSAITNFTYLSAPPASQLPLDNVLAGVAAADGAHDLKVYLPLCTPGWWEFVSEPTAAEVAAGLPEGCYGVYVTAADARKGWIVASDDVDASLVVTDMTQDGNSGYTIHSGLAQGDRLTLSREGFTACDLQHFNRATGAWETFETKRASSFEYVHDGRLTRARWKIDGYALFFTSNRYGGSITVSGATPIAGDNIYAPGAVLTVTAAGRTDHPTSHFTVWTAGVTGEATNSATITLTMDADKSLAADFDPDEWLYDATAMTITDGEYTSSAVTLDATAKAVAVPNFSGGQNYMLWLDLSLPVFVPSDPESEYAITSFGIGGNSTFRKIRFGERFTAFTGDRPFSASLIIERLDNLGHTQMKVFPYCFTHNGPANAPLHLTTKYEANDYIPETLVEVKDLWYTGGPYLVGTLRLPNFTTYGGSCNTYFAFSTRTAGVTNLYLTCEALSNLAVSTNPEGNLFHGMALQELTIGATNLTAVFSGAFSGAAATLERMNFLAHAPATAALDNILASYNARTTTSAKPLEIRCSKYAPGWRELAAAVDRSSEEWRTRPAGTWGVYQTAAGKRFYLVQRDSKYDKNPFTLIIMR